MGMWSLLFTLSTALSCVTSAAMLIHVYGYEGGQVDVSCPYDTGYEDYEKYLCKNDCQDHDVLITTTNPKKNKYSIHDDRNKQVFTSTISDLSLTDVGKYWCGVTRTFTDIYTEVKLEVGKGTCCDQSTKLQSYEEGSVSFSCPYDSMHQNSLKYICRGNQTLTCLQQALITSVTANTRGQFTLTDDKKSNEFTVTIANLTWADSGRYLCGVQHTGLDVFSAVDLEIKEWCCVTSKELNGSVGYPLAMECPYPPQHRDNRKFLCKGDHRQNCTDIKPSSQIRFAQQDNVSASSFFVKITKLRAGDAGTYWCGSDSQWGPGNYTKIHLSVVFPQPTSTVSSTTTMEESVRTPSTPLFKAVVFIVPALVLILTFALVILYKYKCHKVQGAAVNMNRNKTKLAAEEDVIYENQSVVVCPKQRPSKPQRTTEQNKDAVDDSMYQNFSPAEDIYCNQRFYQSQ
uniref:polymeric immunoglobulin receptor-like isoform X1 n=1 Tax=Scatophagus argus TaxID=75038 RepID=UPI001ED7D900|nr:polymeric immunoglobulin receptor-like isoform X1 [Scatophagus argus]